jgi:hypothetical protein
MQGYIERGLTALSFVPKHAVANSKFTLNLLRLCSSLFLSSNLFMLRQERRKDRERPALRGIRSFRPAPEEYISDDIHAFHSLCHSVVVLSGSREYNLYDDDL